MFARLLLTLALLTWIRTASTRTGEVPTAPTATSDPVRTNSSGFFCPVVKGISWTLFRGTCYHRRSASFGIKGASSKKIKKHYKTWFEAREECTKLGAKLASVHEQATQENLLKLITGDAVVTDMSEATWIGLQFGAPVNVTFISGPPGEGSSRVEVVTFCYWPAGVRPLPKCDLCWENGVDKCSVTYNDTFHGQWEDGKLYDEAESADFWAPGEPSDDWVDTCRGKIYEEDQQSRAYCERGVDGKPDKGQHCAVILPPDEKQSKLSLRKWAAYWCWMKMRAYICERPAKRSDGSDGNTSTSDEVETQTSATTTSCGVETTTWPDVCASRARAKADEIESEINATKTANSQVIGTIALGDAAAGTTWLGGSASFANLAQSAIDFGRSIGKLCTERIQNPLMTTYKYAVEAISQDKRTQYHRENLISHCKYTPPEDVIKKMPEFFVSPEPKDVTSSEEELIGNMLSDVVENEDDSSTKVHLLMAEVDAVARIALMSLGACAQAMNVSEITIKESSKKAIVTLSEVNDAFKRAILHNYTKPTPYAEDVVAIIKQTAKSVLDKTKKAEQNLEGWSGREKWHEEIVNDTVDALRKNMSHTPYVFHAIAFLPDERSDRLCRRFANDSVVDVGNTDLKFSVLYANNRSEQNAGQAWKKLTDREDAVMNHIFAKSSDDLCKRLEAAISGQKIKKDNFRGGIAAVKCGYEFVWYELAYSYFYAAYSSTDYKWEKKGGAYDAECGQIFFFP